MMPAMYFVAPGAELLTEALEIAGFEWAAADFRKFPDSETHVRLKTNVAGRQVPVRIEVNK